MIFENEPIPLNIPEGVPFYRDECGTVRVNNSRVLLDIVVGAVHARLRPRRNFKTVHNGQRRCRRKAWWLTTKTNKGEVDEYLRIRQASEADKIKEYFQSQPEYIEWLKRFKERVSVKKA